MAEVVNLRRVRKAKARAEAATRAEVNRVQHGVSKGERGRANAERQRLEDVTDGHRLKETEA